MRKYRILAAMFAFVLLAGCTDLGPTAPQDSEGDDIEGYYEGFLGSGS